MDWLRIVEIMVAVAGVGVVFYGLRGVKMQIQASMFSAYTQRYGTIIDRLPYGARDPKSTARLDEFGPEDQREIRTVVRHYLNLCSEEHYLSNADFIERKAWEVWKRGMRETMRLAVFAETWKDIREEYAAYPDFQVFVDELVSPRLA